MVPAAKGGGERVWAITGEDVPGCCGCAAAGRGAGLRLAGLGTTGTGGHTAGGEPATRWRTGGGRLRFYSLPAGSCLAPARARRCESK